MAPVQLSPRSMSQPPKLYRRHTQDACEARPCTLVSQKPTRVIVGRTARHRQGSPHVRPLADAGSAPSWVLVCFASQFHKTSQSIDEAVIESCRHQLWRVLRFIVPAGTRYLGNAGAEKQSRDGASLAGLRDESSKWPRSPQMQKHVLRRPPFLQPSQYKPNTWQ
ncbi:hypothetical protein EJ04DRAFT_161529 [Polyplosphaeria fusca]|uniref:Uncharacterized protein n=1 Tax=Polyplosphaeria fusca TaxID=682080 RepID=A0A9P4V8H8_9PLEO|nr:hypothetical protein EJ04DRAFT_161529 [Polyplosphaeria fusca]